jgi:hypothetical protein
MRDWMRRALQARPELAAELWRRGMFDADEKRKFVRFVPGRNGGFPTLPLGPVQFATLLAQGDTQLAARVVLCNRFGLTNRHGLTAYCVLESLTRSATSYPASLNAHWKGEKGMSETSIETPQPATTALVNSVVKNLCASNCVTWSRGTEPDGWSKPEGSSSHRLETSLSVSVNPPRGLTARATVSTTLKSTLLLRPESTRLHRTNSKHGSICPASPALEIPKSRRPRKKTTASGLLSDFDIITTRHFAILKKRLFVKMCFARPPPL